MNHSSCLCLLLSCMLLLACGSTPQQSNKKPNVVIIFLDDSGWGDFAPYGQKDIPTPHVDQLAREGRTFNNFYVPQAICSASRAALLTGCYPGRTGVFNAHPPKDKGLDPAFPTMAEVFKNNGYKTALFGKWHLGDQEGRRPHDRGFDESSGLMYSNDMWEYHPENPEYWGQFPLQFWKNGEVTIDEVTTDHQKELTKWYTEHAVDFIQRNKDEPFFLYLPHSMPHVPIFCSDAFEGKSGAGLYGDVIMELDWSVGQIVQALDKHDLSDNTIVLFSSDNGPWIAYGNHAGFTPYREAKATSFDGGTRVACIMKYPEQLEVGSSSDRTFYSIDLLPTLCHLTTTPLPSTPVDGKNIWDLLTGQPDAQNPNAYYPITTGNRLEAIMSGDGKWKLHLPHTYRTLVVAGKDGLPGKYEQRNIELSLFDLESDPYEQQNVILEHPEIADQLQQQAKSHQQQFNLK